MGVFVRFRFVVVLGGEVSCERLLVVLGDETSCERLVVLRMLINSVVLVGRALNSPPTPLIAGDEAIAKVRLRKM